MPNEAAHPRRRETLAPFVLALVGVLAVVAGTVAREVGRGRELVGHEDRALAALFRLEAAEAGHHAATGRYAFVEELAASGWLEGMEIAGPPGERYVRSSGYRLDVLLPHAEVGPAVLVTPRRAGAAEVDPALAMRHHAVVARPLSPGGTGYRTYYIDEGRELFLHEGVVDDAGAASSRLPSSLVRGNVALSAGAPILWQRFSDLLSD